MSTKTIRVAEATNIQLDWLVAKCEGVEVEYINDGITRCLLRLSPFTGRYSPTTDWSQMGPIIEREEITIDYRDNETQARVFANFGFVEARAGKKQGLTAAARCYCCAKLGETVEVPEELA